MSILMALRIPRAGVVLVSLLLGVSGYPALLPASACTGWKSGDNVGIMGSGALRDGSAGECVIDASSVPNAPTAGESYTVRVTSNGGFFHKMYSSDGQCLGNKGAADAQVPVEEFTWNAQSNKPVSFHALCAPARMVPYAANPVGGSAPTTTPPSGTTGEANNQSPTPQTFPNGFNDLVLPEINMKLSYEISKSEPKSIEIKVKTISNAWVGFGISRGKGASMTGDGEGADVFVCSGQEVRRYWFTEYARPSTSQPVPGGTCERLAGETIMTFTRTLSAQSKAQRSIEPGKSQQIIYAHGADDQQFLKEHPSGMFGAARLDFATGKVNNLKKTAEASLYAHIICMIFAWGFLLPLGAVVANSYRRHAKWLKIHIAFQLSGWTFQIVGLVMALWYVEEHAQHWHSYHAISGVIICSFGTLAPFIGFMRPKKQENGVGEKCEQSPSRRAWELVHKGFGRIVIVLALANIVSGIALLAGKNIESTPTYLAIGQGSVSVLLVVIVWICGIYRNMRIRPISSE